MMYMDNTNDMILNAIATMLGAVTKEREHYKGEIQRLEVWVDCAENAKKNTEDNFLPQTKLLATLEGQKFRGPSRDLLRLMRDEFGIPEVDVEEGLIDFCGDYQYVHDKDWGFDSPSKRGSMKKVYQRLEELGVIDCMWYVTHYFPEVYWTELGALLVTEIPEVFEPKGAWKWHEKLWNLARRELNNVEDEDA